MLGEKCLSENKVTVKTKQTNKKPNPTTRFTFLKREETWGHFHIQPTHPPTYHNKAGPDVIMSAQN